MKTVIEMAREAGICTWLKPPEDVAERLEHFAALVRADEREACAKVAEDSDHFVGGNGYYDQLGDAYTTVRNIVASIRARGETK